MKPLYCLFILMSFPVALLADNESRFIAGTIELSEGDYAAAVDTFDALAAEHPSPQVFYNIALSQQQMELWGSARLNYERALALDPRYDDARQNLNYLLSELRLEAEPPRALERYGQWLNLGTWVWIAAIAFWLWVLLRILDHYDRWQHWSATLLRFLAILIFASACTFAFLQRNTVHEAILLGGQSPLRVAPTQESPLLRDLAEADKVRILAQHGSFFRVRLASGEEGFVEKNALAPIIPTSKFGSRQ